MKYEEIIKEIELLENDNLSLLMMQHAMEISAKMRHILFNEMREGKLNAQERYDGVCEYFISVLSNKLEENTSFDQEVIGKIMAIFNQSFVLEDIAVVDKTVLVKGKSIKNFDRESHFVLFPQKDLVELSRVLFTVKEEIFQNLLLFSLNNVLKKNLSFEDEPMVLDGNKISYNTPDLKVYFSNNVDMQEQDALIHFLVQYKENIFAFDIKMRDGYLILVEQNTLIWKLSEQENVLQKKIV